MRITNSLKKKKCRSIRYDFIYQNMSNSRNIVKIGPRLEYALYEYIRWELMRINGCFSPNDNKKKTKKSTTVIVIALLLVFSWFPHII